jgi:hypothetical protein
MFSERNMMRNNDAMMKEGKSQMAPEPERAVGFIS